MILRKVMSLALAIGMLGAAFLAFAVPVSAADQPDGQVTTNNYKGAQQDLFFWYDSIFFQVEYKIGSEFAGAPIDVRVCDIGGNTVGGVWKDTYYDSGYKWITVNTNSSVGAKPGFYDSWWNDFYFSYGGGPNQYMQPGMTYYIEARQHNTSINLFTSQLSILQNQIVITPDQTQYMPGQTVNINVTYDWETYLSAAKVNVNISKWMGSAASIGATWINRTLTDYSWNVDWVIPATAEIGLYTVYVNNTWPNWQDQQMATSFQVGYFTLDVSTNKQVYLPGENATISWLTRSVADNSIVGNATLDWDMKYTDGLSGKVKWSNTSTPLSGSPSTVALPSQADINDDIMINATVKQGSKSANMMEGIILGNLQSDVSTDKGSYKPGESVGVIVDVWVQDESSPAWSAADKALVTFALYNADGKLMPVNITAKTTGASGEVIVVFAIPADFEVDNDYMIVASASKIGYTALSSSTFNVEQVLDVIVLTDKDIYTSGENILVNLNILKNGAAVVPDSIEYWLWLDDSAIEMPHVVVTSSATEFVIAVPAGQQGDAQVKVIVTIGEEKVYENSEWLSITPLIITVGASVGNYYAGDTVVFTVLVAGESAGFSVTYDIRDARGSPVQNGPLTLTDNSAEFSLAIPANDPSESYSVRVIANNNAGIVVKSEMQIDWIADYLISMKIETAPASANGAYAAGQELTVSFEITKMSTEVANITLIKATVSLVGMTSMSTMNGEIKSFTTMSGKLTIVLPKETTNGWYRIVVAVDDSEGNDVANASEMITVNSNGGTWGSNIGGNMSMTDLMLAVMMVVVILMLLWQMIKGKGAAAGTGGKKAAEPKAKEEEIYSPKATVACVSCSSPIEVATSKRPIEVMCPKCGKSQMIN